MKKLFISAILTSMLLCFPFAADAALLSPGLSVIQKSVIMEKSGVAKNTVTFSAEDFENALGVDDISAVKITSLPDAESGKLKLGNNDVVSGDIITRDEISSLYFVPAENGATASFGFIPCESEYVSEFTCVVSMTQENLDLAPITKPDVISDMAGITVFSVLCAEDSDGEELHFSDQAAFCKFFKKHYAVSPMEYRRKLRMEH